MNPVSVCCWKNPELVYISELLTFIVTVNEFHYQTISCPDGNVIKIIDAVYGRGNTCIGDWSAHDIIVAECDDKQSCLVYASNTWFGDPCPTIVKFLTVEYQCVEDHQGI